MVLYLTLSSANEGVRTPGENGNLSGTVNYRDTERSVNKPDAGSAIYAINEADLASSDYKNIAVVVGNFQVNKSEYALSRYNTIDPVLISKAQENFETASDFTRRYVSGFTQLPGIVKTYADGNGNYSLRLRPGKYYILAVSGSVKDKNEAEKNGVLDLGVADVKAGGEAALNVTFKTDGVNLVMYQMSRRSLPGC